MVMTNDEIVKLGAVECKKALEEKKFSAVENIKAFQEKIDKMNQVSQQDLNRFNVSIDAVKKYIDKILSEWSKKGYKKASDVRKKKSKEIEKIEIYEYDWLDDNEQD